MSKAFWTPVVRRVLRDAEATTDLDLAWRFELLTTEPVPGPPGLTLWFGDDGPGERAVDPPRLQLRLPRTWFELPDLDDVDEAVLFLADRLQDHVVEELHGGWPTCPGHTHPMQPSRGAVWRCPAGPERVVDIGALGA